MFVRCSDEVNFTCTYSLYSQKNKTKHHVQTESTIRHWVVNRSRRHVVPSFAACKRAWLSIAVENSGHVHLAYNSSYSACFSAGTVIFCHEKSANCIFQSAYNSSRTAPPSPSDTSHSCRYSRKEVNEPNLLVAYRRVYAVRALSSCRGDGVSCRAVTEGCRFLLRLQIIAPLRAFSSSTCCLS
jgi:hypothetical protein